MTLEAGKEYFWCRCGKSKAQPFCVASHRDTSITPLKFTAETAGDVALCQCKSSANAPFCDGTHATLASLEIGDPALAPSAKDGVPVAAPTPEEPTVARIHELARDGLSKQEARTDLPLHKSACRIRKTTGTDPPGQGAIPGFHHSYADDPKIDKSAAPYI